MATKDEPMSLPQTLDDKKEDDQKAEGSPSAPQDSTSHGTMTGESSTSAAEDSSTGRVQR